MTDGFGKWKTMTSDYDYDQLGNRFNCGSGFLRIIEWFHRNGVRLRALAAVQMAGVFFEAFGEASEMEGGVCFQAGLWKEIVARWMTAVLCVWVSGNTGLEGVVWTKWRC